MVQSNTITPTEESEYLYGRGKNSWSFRSERDVVSRSVEDRRNQILTGTMQVLCEAPRHHNESHLNQLLRFQKSNE